jgi:D-alanine transaminase
MGLYHFFISSLKQCLVSPRASWSRREFLEKSPEIGYIGNENSTDSETIMTVYLNGEFLEKEKALISVEDRAFLFADGVYEVIRCYEGRPFRLDEHLNRLDESIRAIRIDFSDSRPLGDIAKRLIVENRLTKGDALIYIEITRGSAARAHIFPPKSIKPTVYVSTVEFHPKHTQIENGISVILVPDVRWTRCDVKAVGLLPNVLMAQRALDEGVDDAIFVRDGVAIEGTASNVFGVFDGVVVTHPKTNLTLAGVTRDVVLELCAKLGLPTREAPIMESQLSQAEEFFVTSTTMEITPVVRVDGQPVGSGKPGPIARRIQKEFREVVRSSGN